MKYLKLVTQYFRENKNSLMSLSLSFSQAVHSKVRQIGCLGATRSHLTSIQKQTTIQSRPEKAVGNGLAFTIPTHTVICMDSTNKK